MLFVLFLLVALGRGLWLAIAWSIRSIHRNALYPTKHTSENENPKRCAQCGSRLSRFGTHCPACGQNSLGSLEDNLRDLKTTLRQLRALNDDGALDFETFERARQCLQARLVALTAKPEPKPVEIFPDVVPVIAAPEPEAAPQPALTQPPLLQPQIGQLLEVCQDIREVVAEKTERVAEWGHRVRESDNPIVAAFAAAPTEGVDVEPVKAAEPTPEKPRKPRRSLAEVFGAFMQESNIVWGELIAGLVMVGSSVALVISLWKTLEESVPYFPFLIFTAITVAIFGAGLYSLSHWKLESTSRGLLTIATLLVPLNFLVMAGLLVQHGVGAGGLDLFRLASEAVALGVFSYLLGKAGRVLVPDGRWLLALAVLGISASALASPRLLAEENTDLWRSLAAGLLPVACFVAGTGGMLYRLPRPVDARRAKSLLLFLGVATFPLVLALGFLVFWSQDIGLEVREAFQRLSFLLAVAGVPVLTSGLVIQRMGGEVPDRGLATLRTAGTAVACIGVAGMLAAVPLAWPSPGITALVCIFNFVALTIVAIRLGMPLAHAAALPCLAIGYLSAYHHFFGLSAGADSDQFIAILLSEKTGTVLVGLVIALAVAAELLVRTSYRIHGIYYACAGSILALASLAIVNAHGFGNPGNAALVTGIYAVGGLAANQRWRRAPVDYLALALVPVATLWALGWRLHDFSPYWGLVLAGESLILAVVALAGRAWQVTPPAWRLTSAGVAFVSLCLSLIAMAALPTEMLAGSLAILALTFLLLARNFDEVVFSWFGALLLLGCFVDLSLWDITRERISDATSIAILSHASLLLFCRLLLRKFAAKGSSTERLYSRPLPWVALISTFMAPACLALEIGARFDHLAGYTAWIAAIWLAIAVLLESRFLFAAFQAAATGSVLFGVTSWLQIRPWVQQWPNDLLGPRSLQAYGVGLAGLGLVWLVGRFLTRRNQRAQELFNPGVPAFDWVVLGVLVLGQFAWPVWEMAPEVLREILPTGQQYLLPANFGSIFGPGAWLLLGILTIDLVVALRVASLRSRATVDEVVSDSSTQGTHELRAALFGLVFLAVTAPVLWAGSFIEDGAATSALCCGMSVCFVMVSSLFWLRTSLARMATATGIGAGLDGNAATDSRRLLIALTALPVVMLSVFVTVAGVVNSRMTLPLEGSFFARVSPVAPLAAPPMIVAIGLVGHALRERSARYAFAAGLVVNLAVSSAYLVAVITSGNGIEVVETVRLLQLASLTAAIWSLLAMASRSFVTVWQESSDRQMARALFSIQQWHGLVGNAILLFVGITLLVTQFPDRTSWSVEVGSPLGWAAFGLALGAVVWPAVRAGRLPVPHSFGVLGLVVGGIAACSILRWQPAWAYRTLMLGWAGYMPLLIGAAWQWRRRQLPAILGPVLEPRNVASWVRFTGVAVVLLGMNAAIVHQDRLWAAAAIAVAGAAGAAMAVWQRRENWAFTAGLCVNLAASLVVWHFHLEEPFESWWLFLIQANILSAALVGLLWLSARRLLYVGAELRPQSAPLLTTQIAMAFGGNALLLIWPCVRIILEPWSALPFELAPIGSLLGWVTLALSAAGAFWYASLELRGQRSHVLLLAGLLFAILGATSEGLSHPEQSWLAYHVLLAAWTGLGLVLVGAEPLSRQRNAEDADFSPFPYWATFFNLSAKHFRQWLFAIGLLVLLLALRAAGTDPQRPYWSSGATLAVALMAGATAIRSRSQPIVYVSGLLVPLAGFFAWIAWNPLGQDMPSAPAVYSLGYTLLLGLAIASTLWSLVEFTLRSGTPSITFREEKPAFAHEAAWLAAMLGGLLVVEAFVGDLMFTGLPVSWLLPAGALSVLALVFLTFLWDAEAPSPMAGLYAVGMLVLALGLQSAALSRDRFGWTATFVLSGYILLTAILARSLPLLDDLWQALRLKPQAEWPAPWYLSSQTLAGFLVVALTLWIALSFDARSERVIGSLALAPLILTGILLTTRESRFFAWPFRGTTLSLAALMAVELSWASLDPSGLALNLHRHVLLLLALAVMTLFEGVVLPRLLGTLELWVDSARRMGPRLLALTMLILVGLLGHEAGNYDPVTKHTPLVLWEALAVAAALVGLIASGICFAVAPSTDPYRLSEPRRPLYVYAAELLLLFLFVHIRLNVPELFGGVLTQFWPLLVMVIAFIGIGLSEYFDRCGIKVLSQPLKRTGVFMPLLPLLAFWIKPPQPLHDFLVRCVPALQPSLEPLMKLQPNFGRYAIIWFSLGLLYSWVARINHSFRFALLAALAGNFGIWALLYNAELSFFSHPQVWMIPLALIVLVSEHVNRQELGPQKSNALRYIGLIMIYVSSTADMFLAWGENAYLPLVLAGLSVLGVLAGILFRVTAFLYLGTSFLFVVVFSMIWHAAVDGRQMWLWWACGIGLGAVIFALFAVFEKRREDVLKLIEDIKSWD